MAIESKPPSAPVRVFYYLLAIAVVGIIAGVAVIGWGIKYYNAPSKTQEEITVIIPKGSGFEGATNILHENGVIEHPLAFSIAAVVLDKSHLIKAGEYAFPAGTSPKEVLSSLVEGKTVVHKITIPEGLTTTTVLALVEADDRLSGDIPADIQEGELLPDTYYFSRGDNRSELVGRMKRDMRSLLMELWEKRRPDLPFRTPQEALVLASIIEKETGVSSEYRTVSSVYINRLRKGMLLQADPTVIYAVTKGKEPLGRPLKYSDLRMKSPYNTYVTLGLPPGPIASPGRRALSAAFDPEETNYIFFVADGRGGHNFSVTLDEHNSFVSQFRAILKNQQEKKMDMIPEKAN